MPDNLKRKIVLLKALKKAFLIFTSHNFGYLRR